MLPCLKNIVNMPIGDRGGKLGGNVTNAQNPKYNQEQCKNTPFKMERIGFTITNCGKGNNRHVKRIKPTPAFDQTIAQCPDRR